jgi:hypothetical protein
MNQSDLSKLQTFVKTLPQDKVLSYEWSERYINDIETFPQYNSAKTTAIKMDRYVNQHDMVKYGYSLRPYEGLCDSPLKSDEYCHECCDKSNLTLECEYDPEKCNRFFAETVTNWSELCGYHILFLQGKTPGTPNHPGPWNRETEYILDSLIRILKKGILSVESQPGLMVKDNHDEFIQKPYLVIGGPAGRIHRILIEILYPKGPVTVDNSIIKYVPYPLESIDFSGYVNYNSDSQDYVKIVLGIDHPPMLSSELMKYIFSNRFFDRIADIVETTA